MEVFFLDTSALAKRYVEETGSTWISGLFNTDENLIYISELAIVELTSAIIRRSKGGTISPDNASAVLSAFDLHLLNDYFVLDINSNLLSDARSLITKHGLRGYDAVQLAVAENLNRLQTEMNLSPVTLVSADDELLAAAQQDGLVIENPNDHK